MRERVSKSPGPRCSPIALISQFVAAQRAAIRVLSSGPRRGRSRNCVGRVQQFSSTLARTWSHARMGGNRSMGVWSIVVLLLSASTAAAQSAPLVNAVKNQDQATVRPLLEKSVNLDTDSLPTRTGARVNVARAHLLHIDVGVRAMPAMRRGRAPRRSSRARWCGLWSRTPRIDAANKRGQTTTAIAVPIRPARATISRGPPAPGSLQKLEAVEKGG